MPNYIEEWLRSKLPSVTDRNQTQRRVVEALPYQMVREAVVNALVHRDYDIEGAKCQLVVTPGEITIMSPGEPLPQVTLDGLRNFTAPMLSRNPKLHFVFGAMKIAEERGVGLRTLKRRSVELGLPLPRYQWQDPYIKLTLFRNLEAGVASSTRDLKLSEVERRGWEWMLRTGETGSADYAKAMKLDERTARRHLNRFWKLKLVTKTGAARSTKYKVT